MRRFPVRVLSLLLCVSMLIGMLPSVYAAEEETVEVTTEATEPVTEPATEPEETTAETTGPVETTAPEESTEPTETTQPEETTEPTETTEETESTGPQDTTEETTAETEEDLAEDGELYWEETDYMGRTVSISAVPMPEGVATFAEERSASFRSKAAAAEYVRSQMVLRSDYIQFTYIDENGGITGANCLDIVQEIAMRAMVHTGSPVEGDYILWQYAGMLFDCGYSRTSIKVNLPISYYTTAAQEAEMNSAVASTLARLNLGGKTDYEKVKAIYDFVTSTVTYDYSHMGNSSYKLQFTGYAALINHTAVCQGYAVLMYRLLLESGIDCRVITGVANGGPHAWNIVKLGGKYYNLDATWDAGRTNYNYFLRVDANLFDHYRDGEYNTSAFHAAYPMGKKDYDPADEMPKDQSGTCGENLTWTWSKGTLTISGDGPMDNWNPGDTPWKDLIGWTTSVSIGDGVTSVGMNAFLDCVRLTSVTLGQGITSIEPYAFQGCSALTEIRLPDGLKELGSAAFAGCTSLERIAIPSGVAAIEESTFCDCSSLVEVILPNGLTEIKDRVFRQCSSLENIVLPDSVTKIGVRAFEQCEKLRCVTLPEYVTTIGDYAFGYCSGLTDLILPRSVSTIGRGAFYSTNLKRVYYGGSQTDQKDIMMWGGNESLTYATWIYNIDGSEVTPNSCGNNLTWTLENGTLTISGTGEMWNWKDERHVPWNDSLDQIRALTIENGVTSIGEWAFWECTNLTEVSLPKSLDTIGGWSFGTCKMTALSLPDSVSYIGPYAFSGCRSLKSVTLPRSLTEIEEGAFVECFALTDITIPEGVVSVGPAAFDSCTGLKEVLLPETVTSLGEYAFYDCGNLTSVNIPSGVTSLEYGVFGNCFRLSSVSVPEGVQSIAQVAFGGCRSLNDLVLPKSLKSIALSAFIDCQSLTDVYYNGTEEDRAAIAVEEGNEPLTGAVWHCAGPGPQPETLTIDREYLILEAGSEPVVINTAITPGTATARPVWRVEGDPVVSIASDGEFACIAAPVPGAQGTAYLVAEIEGTSLSARCRIDVTAPGTADLVERVTLSDSSLTVELYQTSYSRFRLFTELAQNRFPNTYYSAGPESGIGLIATARFTGDLAAYFTLEVQDDGWVNIIPTEKAIQNPGSVKSSYADAEVLVTVGQRELSAGTVKLMVKKTTPKIKASTMTLNSFIDFCSLPIPFTGDKVLAMEPDYSKTFPDWVYLSDIALDLGLNRYAAEKQSGTVHLLVQVDGYVGKWPVSVPVKAAYMPPKLALSASSVTMCRNPADSKGIPMKLVSKERGVDISEMEISHFTAPEGYEICDFSLEDGSFLLKPTSGWKPGTVELLVEFNYTGKVLPLKLKVNPSDVSVKPEKSSLTLNPVLVYRTSLNLTFTPADFDPRGLDNAITVLDKNGNPAEDQLNVTFNGNTLDVYTTPQTKENSTYTVYIQPGSRVCKLTVKTLASGRTEITSTLRASGGIDLSFPDSEALIRPTFKNYEIQGDEAFDWAITTKNGANVNSLFRVTIDPADGAAHVTANDPGSLNPREQYSFHLSTQVAGRWIDARPVKLTVKQTALTVKLSKTSISLNPDFPDRADIAVTSGTRGYEITEPRYTCPSQLDADFSGGVLTVKAADNAVPGATYKIGVYADQYATRPAILTVKIAPQSDIKITAKMKGTLDAIRPGSAAEVTATLSNFLNAEAVDFALDIYPMNGKTLGQTPCTDQFVVAHQDGGAFTVRPTERVDSSLKYAVVVTASLASLDGQIKTFISTPVSLTVKMGSARMAADKKAVTLYANDIHSSEVVTLTSADETLAPIDHVRIKGSDAFQAQSLGGGRFAIGFTPGKDLPARAPKLTLEVYLAGNHTDKPNASLPVTVNILR